MRAAPEVSRGEISRAATGARWRASTAKGACRTGDELDAAWLGAAAPFQAQLRTFSLSARKCAGVVRSFRALHTFRTFARRRAWTFRQASSSEEQQDRGV